MNTKDKNLHTGDMVLGMHDALVSLTGLIAGMVAANGGRDVIVLTSVIASVVAGLSMAASNYLARGADNQSRRSAFISGLHTGGAYLVTCAILMTPFAFIENVRVAMFATFGVTVLVIGACNLVVARQTGRGFWPHFWEMLMVCGAVSVAGYIIGEIAKYALGITI